MIKEISLGKRIALGATMIASTGVLAPSAMAAGQTAEQIQSQARSIAASIPHANNEAIQASTRANVAAASKNIPTNADIQSQTRTAVASAQPGHNIPTTELPPPIPNPDAKGSTTNTSPQTSKNLSSVVTTTSSPDNSGTTVTSKVSNTAEVNPSASVNTLRNSNIDALPDLVIRRPLLIGVRIPQNWTQNDIRNFIDLARQGVKGDAGNTYDYIPEFPSPDGQYPASQTLTALNIPQRDLYQLPPVEPPPPIPQAQ